MAGGVKQLLARHRMKLGLGLVLLALVLAVLVAFEGPVGHWVSGTSEWMVGLVRDAPAWVFFLAMALVPIAGLPIMPFYLASGAAYGLWASLFGVGVALIINLCLSYWIARWLRGPVSRLLARAGWKIPQVPASEYMPFTVMVRLAPGAPLMVQNYVLGLAGAPFVTYLGVSWCAEMLIASGYILTAESLYAKNWSFLFAGIGLIVFIVLLTRLLRRRLKSYHLPKLEKSE